MTRFAVDVDALVRVVAAVGLGAVVGFEREANDQAAGLRTHISVALGACVFGIISTLGFAAYEDADSTNVRIDVTRVASQVVVGIGFIGAGVIFRHGATVRNLTTAASLWVTAAIGLAVGIGDLALAFVATVGLVASLALLRLPRRWIRRYLTTGSHEISVRLQPDADREPVLQMLRTFPAVELRALHTEKHDGRLVLLATAEVAARVGISELLDRLSVHDDVEDVRVVFERDPATD